MNRQMAFLLCIFLALALLSCAKQPVLLDNVLVQNATTGSITNVKVRHEPTMKFGSVSMVLPRKALDIGLSRQPLLSDKAVLSWRDGEGREWSTKVAIPYDRSAASKGQPMSLVYVIYPSGQVAVHLQPADTLH
jgi:hypothetical protein